MGWADFYDKSGLGNIGHALNTNLTRTAGALAGAPADIAGGVKGFYGGLGSKLQGGADNAGNIAVGAANTTGKIATQVPIIIRDVTVPLGSGLGAVGAGAGNALTGAGRGLESTGSGVGDFGRYFAIGLVIVLALAVVYVFSTGKVRA